MQDCSAGDSAAYQRRNSTLDDVVIVAALRTPMTKVRTPLVCFIMFVSLSSHAQRASSQADRGDAAKAWELVVAYCMRVHSVFFAPAWQRSGTAANGLHAWWFLLLQAKRGGLKDTDAVDLLSTVFKAVLDRTRLNPGDIGDIVVGSVLGPSSQRANEARIASFFAGIPEEVPVRTVNRYVDRLLNWVVRVLCWHRCAHVANLCVRAGVLAQEGARVHALLVWCSRQLPLCLVG